MIVYRRPDLYEDLSSRTFSYVVRTSVLTKGTGYRTRSPVQFAASRILFSILVRTTVFSIFISKTVF
jgi:hypothetical protein